MIEAPSITTRSPHAEILLQEFSDVFQDIPPVLPCGKRGSTIEIGSSPPVSNRLSPKENEEVKRQVKDLLNRGLIRPSQSPYGSPVLFAQKKDVSLRMGIDHQALNAITADDKYPLPRIDDLLDRLKGAKILPLYICNRDITRSALQMSMYRRLHFRPT